MDRVLAEAGSNLAPIRDLERNGERAGAQDEREILRRLKILAAHRDLTVGPNGTLNNRWTTHDSLVEYDRHEILDMPRGLGAKPPSAFDVHGELDEIPFGRRSIRL